MKFRKFFGFAGGQRNLLPILLQLLPKHKTYVEFCGGGATLLLNKEPSEFEVYNDINKRLVDIFLALQKNPDEFERQLKLLPNSREMFSAFKRDVKSEPDDIRRAVMSYYLIVNTWSGKTADPSFVAKNIEFKKDVPWFARRMSRVTVENMDFERVIEKYDAPNTLHFGDAPYYEIEGLYEYEFSFEDHRRLANCLKNIDGLFLITYNSHPAVELLYKGFYMFEYENAMTMAYSKVRTTQTHLIVANFDIVNRRFPPFSAKYFRF